MFRDDEINLNQMMALAVTDDHSAQERVWDSAKEWQKSPHALRRALTQSMVDAGDARVRFVGIDVYINAGGLIERDLFEEEHEGYLTDTAKLDRLTRSCSHTDTRGGVEMGRNSSQCAGARPQQL